MWDDLCPWCGVRGRCRCDWPDLLDSEAGRREMAWRAEQKARLRHVEADGDLCASAVDDSHIPVSVEPISPERRLDIQRETLARLGFELDHDGVLRRMET